LNSKPFQPRELAQDQGNLNRKPFQPKEMAQDPGNLNSKPFPPLELAQNSKFPKSTNRTPQKVVEKTKQICKKE